MALHVVVLAGGSGTRLWPLSRSAVPKHLLPLASGGRSLLRATLDRVQPLTESIWVVTITAQARQCAEELEAAGLDPARVIAEPAARGTGPALGLAMGTLARRDPEAVVASVHADHHVVDDHGYRAAVWQAAGWARATGGLATVAISPTEPSTGFGYIELGDAEDGDAWVPPADDGNPLTAEALGPPRSLLPADRAVRFVEKPDRATAEAYLAGGRHVWNTGLFAWRASTFLGELAQASPPTAEGVEATLTARADGDEAGAEAAYTALPNEAVDTLVLERTPLLTAVRASFGWSDLGSWADLAAARRAAGEADSEGNVVEGDALLAASTRDCYIDARGGRRIAVVGAEGLVVVDTGDAVLILAADRSQGVKQVVDQLKRERRTDLL